MIPVIKKTKKSIFKLEKLAINKKNDQKATKKTIKKDLLV